jgi:hypothetical protein
MGRSGLLIVIVIIVLAIAGYFYFSQPVADVADPAPAVEAPTDSGLPDDAEIPDDGTVQPEDLDVPEEPAENQDLLPSPE